MNNDEECAHPHKPGGEDCTYTYVFIGYYYIKIQDEIRRGEPAPESICNNPDSYIRITAALPLFLFGCDNHQIMPVLVDRYGTNPLHL